MSYDKMTPRTPFKPVPFFLPKPVNPTQNTETVFNLTHNMNIVMSARKLVVFPPSEELKESGITIVFEEISYFVWNKKNTQEKKFVLENVSGYMLPAQMTALMGPSGSGKTTLLDILAGRKSQKKVMGDILFCGRKPSVNFLRLCTGYVEQYDTLISTLTVKEMLMYTAELKRPITEAVSEKQKVVNKLIFSLALEMCQDTLIGTATVRGISGGQSKRTNIGIALVGQPQVLFLDEPTSGLDSVTSDEVMKVVKGLVTGGTTICATIHSPTQRTFRLFDKVLLLLQGQMVYFGNNSKQMVKYFKELERIDEIYKSIHEAEWIVDIITRADREGRGTQLAQIFQSSLMSNVIKQKILQIKQGSSNFAEQVYRRLDALQATTTPIWWGIKIIFWYRIRRNYYDPLYLFTRLCDKILAAVINVTLYIGIGNNVSPTNAAMVYAIGGLMLTWCVMPAFGASSYIPSIVMERPLFIRERNDGLYLPITYLTTKILDELVLQTFATIIFAALVFFPVQLQGSFFVFWLVHWVTLSIGIALSYFIIFLSSSVDFANIAFPVYVMLQVFMAGYLIRYKSIPNYWEWFSRINPLRYAFSALMYNQFGENNPEIYKGITTLEYFGADELPVRTSILIELCFLLMFIVLAGVTVSLKKFHKL